MCLQPGYERAVLDLCPNLVALDSRRKHLPDLSKEIQILEESSDFKLPEPEPWLTPDMLNVEDLISEKVISEALQPHVDEFGAALAECNKALEEVEQLLNAQHLAE